MIKCLIVAAYAWSFVGNDAVVLPPIPLGTVVTVAMLAVVRAEICSK